MRSVFSTLLCRRKQQCGLLLSPLQQLVSGLTAIPIAVWCSSAIYEETWGRCVLAELVGQLQQKVFFKVGSSKVVAHCSHVFLSISCVHLAMFSLVFLRSLEIGGCSSLNLSGSE